jgi:hypothetical protein
MPHYKDTHNNLHFIDNITYSNILPTGCIQISDDEANDIQSNQINNNTPEKIKQSIVESVQTRLDNFGKTREYDGTISIGKYVNIPDSEIDNLPEPEKSLVKKFKMECQYYSLVTATTWATCYKILNEVSAGNRIQPSGYQDIEDELPTLEWPI